MVRSAVVRQLVEAGADVNHTCNDGKCALYYVAEDRSGFSTLQYLVQQGGDLARRADDGSTLLLAAVMGESIDIVNYLLDKGLDPMVANDDGETAMSQAMEYEAWKIVERLGLAGCDVLQAVGSGADARSPLVAVAEHGQLAILKHWREKGIDILSKDSKGATALDIVRGEHRDSCWLAMGGALGCMLSIT